MLTTGEARYCGAGVSPARVLPIIGLLFLSAAARPAFGQDTASVSWRWRYVLPSLGLWLTAMLVLVVPYVVGKRQQDWPVVVCIVLSFILFQMEGASILVVTLIGALVVVWLIRRRRIPSAEIQDV